MNISSKDIPPGLEKLLKMFLSVWGSDLARSAVKVLEPWFGWADKVSNLDVLPEPNMDKEENA
jgi:hypothetical protein